MQAELYFSSEANLSASLSFLVFQHQLRSPRRSQPLNQPVELGIVQLPVSHTSLPVCTRRSLVLRLEKSSQHLLWNSLLLFFVILRGQVKKRWNSGSHVLYKARQLLPQKQHNTAPEVTLPGSPSDSTTVVSTSGELGPLLLLTGAARENAFPEKLAPLFPSTHPTKNHKTTTKNYLTFTSGV